MYHFFDLNFISFTKLKKKSVVYHTVLAGRALLFSLQLEKVGKKSRRCECSSSKSDALSG